MVVFFFRDLHIVIGDTPYEKHRFLAWLFNCIEVKPHSLSFYEEAQAALKKNKIVVLFPEGHFFKEEIGPFQESVTYLALSSGASILPVSLDGSYSFFKRSKINIGTEIYLRESASSLTPSEEEAVTLTQALREEIRFLSVQQENYKKYHNFGLFHAHYFLFDFAIPFMALYFGVVNPNHYLFESADAKKSRHPKEGGVLIANHIAYLDAVNAMQRVRFRHLHALVGEIVYSKNNAFVRWTLGLGGCIKLPANPMDFSCIKEAIARLQCNELISIYPEGHINRDLIQTSFHDGAAMFALQSHQPIYPAVSLRNYRLFHHQQVIIGEAIYLEDYLPSGSKTDRESIHRCTLALEEKINELRLKGEKILRNH